MNFMAPKNISTKEIIVKNPFRRKLSPKIEELMLYDLNVDKNANTKNRLAANFIKM